MKSNIIAALSHNHQSSPTDVVKIMFLKQELASLQDTVSVFSSQHLENVQCCADPQHNLQPSMGMHNGDLSQLRTVMASTPYLNHLMENDTDVIALCEHWLWPFDLNFTLAIWGLENPINVFVVMLLSRGCGGVGLIW